MSSKPKILAFAGATRSGSNNKKLIRLAARDAEAAGAAVTLIDLADYPLPLFDGDLETKDGLPANGRKLKDLFIAHHGLLLAAPEYNSSITGVMKNAIDWVSRPVKGEPPLNGFTGKFAALLAASPGALGGLRGLVHVRMILGNLGVVVLPNQLAIAKADAAFDATGEMVDATQRAGVKAVADRLVQVLAKQLV